MIIDYDRCELCGVQTIFVNEINQSKFPVRSFPDGASKEGILAVRCAECAVLPYRLEEGQPSRVDLLGKGDVPIALPDTYNYWPRGIGHLLEIYKTDPSDECLSAIRNDPIEIRFLVEEDVNLIVIAYRLAHSRWDWKLTPYLWHDHKESARDKPPINPSSEAERRFTIAIVDARGGKYHALRSGILPPDFANTFHRVIHEQIARGEPDGVRYRERKENLWRLLNKVDSVLTSRCLI